MSTLLAADDAAQTITRAPSRPSANARANPRTKADDRAIPFYVENPSALAKSLREQLHAICPAATFAVACAIAELAGARGWAPQLSGAARRRHTATGLAACPNVVPAAAFDAAMTAHASKALTQFDERGLPQPLAAQKYAVQTHRDVGAVATLRCAPHLHRARGEMRCSTPGHLW